LTIIGISFALGAGFDISLVSCFLAKTKTAISSIAACGFSSSGSGDVTGSSLTLFLAQAGPQPLCWEPVKGGKSDAWSKSCHKLF
jgi:hypothetical protein